MVVPILLRGVWLWDLGSRLRVQVLGYGFRVQGPEHYQGIRLWVFELTGFLLRI